MGRAGSEVPAGAGEGPSRAEAGDEVRHLPLGLPPDFGPGRGRVRVDIRRIGVLIQVVVSLGVFPGQIVRAFLGSIRRMHRVCIDNVGPVSGENPFALFGGVGAVWVKAKEAPGQLKLFGE